MAKRLLHGAPQTARNCNAAEFLGRTAPRFILDTAAAYLSGIGRKRLPTRLRSHAAASPRASTGLGIGSATRYTFVSVVFRERTYVN